MSKLTILCVLGESSDGPKSHFCGFFALFLFSFWFYFLGEKKFSSDHETYMVQVEKDFFKYFY